MSGSNAAGTTYGITNKNLAQLSASGADNFAIGTDFGPIIFGTNSLERVRITPTGNVGIGTTTPTRQLSIYNVYEDSEARFGDYLYLSCTSGGAPSISFNGYYDGTSGGNYRYGENSVNRHAAMIEYDPIGGNLSFQNSGVTGNANANISYLARMNITANGRVGIGTMTPYYNLHVIGNAGLSTGTAWINASDSRLKDTHGNYQYGLNEVLRLRPIRYSYKKDNPLGLPSDFSKTGFIAQEVQKIIPDAVTTRSDGYLELNVDPIHWAVVNAIKDLYKQYILPFQNNFKGQNHKIDSLEDQVKKLNEENKELKNAICELNAKAKICQVK